MGNEYKGLGDHDRIKGQTRKTPGLRYASPRGRRRKKGWIFWRTEIKSGVERKIIINPSRLKWPMVVYDLGRPTIIHRARTFFGVTTFCDYMWDYELKRWVPSGAFWIDGEELELDRLHGSQGRSSHFNGCHSVKAFRRYLRKWSKYLPAGVEFILCSRISEYDVTGVTTKAT